MEFILSSTDLFAGIGGFALASDRLGTIKTKQFVEIDPSAQKSLSKNFNGIPIHGDIKTYEAKRGFSDLFTIGFPCTNTSAAGDRTGLEGESSGLWFEALRCIAEGRPRYVIVENPPGLINRGLRTVLGGLRVQGYRWDDPLILSGAMLGAPHIRQRLFIVAYAYSRGSEWALPPRWIGEVRKVLKESRDYSRWLQFVIAGDGFNARFPSNMAGFPISVPNGQKARMTKRILYGRSVMPDVAEIPLRRVVQLESYRRFSNERNN